MGLLPRMALLWRNVTGWEARAVVWHGTVMAWHGSMVAPKGLDRDRRDGGHEERVLVTRE